MDALQDADPTRLQHVDKITRYTVLPKYLVNSLVCRDIAASKMHRSKTPSVNKPFVNTQHAISTDIRPEKSNPAPPPFATTYSSSTGFPAPSSIQLLAAHRSNPGRGPAGCSPCRRPWRERPRRRCRPRAPRPLATRRAPPRARVSSTW